MSTALDLEPAWFSRNVGSAVDEDEVDEVEQALPVAPTIVWKSSSVSGQWQCDLLLIGVNPPAVAFLMALFDKQSTLLGSLNGVDSSADLKSESHCSLHGVGINAKSPSSDLLILLIQDHIQADRCFGLVRNLFKAVSAKRIIVLDAMWLGSLTSSFEADPPLLRPLEAKVEDSAESKKANKRICPFLEQPHMISGLPAAIISHCNVFDLNARVFLSLWSPHFPLESTSAFEAVLPLLGRDVKLPEEKTKKTVYETQLKAASLLFAASPSVPSSHPTKFRSGFFL